MGNLSMMRLADLKITRCASAADAVRGADIVTTATADKCSATILTPEMIRRACISTPWAATVREDRIARRYRARQDLRIAVEFEPQARIEEIQQLDAATQVARSRTFCGPAARPGKRSGSDLFDSVGFALNDFSSLRYLRRLNAEQPDGDQRIDLIPGWTIEGSVRQVSERSDPRAGCPPQGGVMPAMTARTASLIGAPSDIGASDRGASMGPEALRVAGIHAALTQRGLDVVDCGNVSGPPNPGLIKVSGYRNLTQVTAWNLEVHDAVYRELTETDCRFYSAAITL